MGVYAIVSFLYFIFPLPMLFYVIIPVYYYCIKWKTS